jgi:hypothetical protein
VVNHQVVLRGLGTPSASSGAMILQRADEDFVEAVLADARQPSLEALRATRAVDLDAAGTLRLFQPVHRTFHLAMFEAVCDVPGSPRLDPAKIESAGLVIRRAAGPRGGTPFGEAWRSDGSRVRGWEPFATAEERRRDPDPARWRLPDQGHPALNARVRAAVDLTPIAEESAPLFVAPPDVCAAAGRTILFAVIPTVSTQAGDTAADTEPYDADEIAAQVPRFLRAGIPPSISSLAGRRYTFESAEALARRAAALGSDEPAGSDGEALRASRQMYGFVEMLKVLSIQLDAFGEGKPARILREKLADVVLAFGAARRDAVTFLEEAADALVRAPGTGTVVLMPDGWPEIPARTAERIRDAFGALLQSRFASFTPRATRFDDPSGRYVAQGFLRVHRDDDCPPDLVWSAPTPPYRVVPWFESSGAPPVLVRLPPIDRETVKKLKPNIAFAVPGNVFNLLGRNKPSDFLGGTAKAAQGGLDWICGFNIPIITLCAFIVLSIFLALLNIIFFWLPFVKICFPVPKKAKELLP